MMQTDVKAAQVTSTNTAYANESRVKGVTVSYAPARSGALKVGVFGRHRLFLVLVSSLIWPPWHNSFRRVCRFVAVPPSGVGPGSRPRSLRGNGHHAPASPMLISASACARRTESV